MDERVAAWAASGAMALTGRSGRTPLGPPAPLVDRLRAFGGLLCDGVGRAMPDPLALLGERAAIVGLTRHGDVSCGGATRLLRARDGWLALSMARPDDEAAVAAWLGLDGDPVDTWQSISRSVATRPVGALVERGVLLGLPVARLGEAGDDDRGGRAPPFDELPVRATPYGRAAGPAARTPLVVDLSSLWAGPLCGHLLQLAGARVVKVESLTRPDGARWGSATFFDLLNGGKQSVAFDFARRDDVDALQRLLVRADVVIEASRPRALLQLGIDPGALLTHETGPRVWLSITGHGGDGDAARRVAFGDDAAVAGGLVVWDGDGPCFCADAIADPASGVVAAIAALVGLRSGRRWSIDVALARVAADLAGPTLDATGVVARPPSARPATVEAAPLGAHTDAVLAELRS